MIRRLWLMCLPLVFAVACVAFAADNAQEASEPMADDSTELSRGGYLRTEVRDAKSFFEIVPSLTVDTPDHQLALVLEKYEITHLTEVRIYETMVRFFVKNEDGTGYFDYRRLPDDLWEGETNVRRLEKKVGFISDAKVLIDEVPCHTDANGRVFADKGNLDLLAAFDDLSCRIHDCLIRCEGLPTRSYRIYRTMPQRSVTDEKRLSEPPAQDALVAYGLDFMASQNQPEQEKLACTVNFPENFAYAVAGKPFPVRIKVQNNGSYQTSCLIARIFSRIDGLDGKLFYFGAIKPGDAVEFTRYICVPTSVKTGKVFAEIRFSDSWNAPQQSLPIAFSVIHSE